MRIFHIFTYYLLGIIAIISLSVFPQYFSSIGVPDSPGYFQQLAAFITELANPGSWLYVLPFSRGEFPIVEVLWEPFIYSMEILIGAILSGFFLAFVLAFIATCLPKPVLHPIKRVLDFLESIPDLVIATLLQALTIYVYKTSGIDLFRVAGYMDDKVYLAPIITLAILPMISMFKLLMLQIEEEFIKDYVVFLKSKGIRHFGILVKHVIKNVMPSSFHHMKIIIWGTLSSQFIIERIFNVHGLTYYMLESFTPMTIAFSLTLIFTPFFLLFQLIDLWLDKDPLRSYQMEKRRLRGKWYPSHVVERTRGFINSFLDYMKRIRISWLWRPFANGLRLFGRHMKNWKFALGSLFFIIVIGYSVVYSVTTDSHVEQFRFLYEENDGIKTLIGAPPFAPPEPFLFGSDRSGFSIFDQIVVGAKYTLIFALIIALLRVFGGLLFGVIYAFNLNGRTQQWLGKMSDSIHFVPLSVIAYILLSPILLSSGQGFTYSFTERVSLEIFILTILVVPLTTVLLGKEMKHVLEYEFISSARVLGANKFRIFWRHVLPHIGPRLMILFGQQFIQVIFILIHLGVLNLFFGGSQGEGQDRTSVTNEWSGLIGAIARGAIRTEKYWYLWVLLAFMLAIFAMQFIIKGVEEVQQQKVGVLSNLRGLHRKKKPSKPKVDKQYQISKDSFTLME